jgi:hypothetical protein
MAAKSHVAITPLSSTGGQAAKVSRQFVEEAFRVFKSEERVAPASHSNLAGSSRTSRV